MVDFLDFLATHAFLTVFRRALLIFVLNKMALSPQMQQIAQLAAMLHKQLLPQASLTDRDNVARFSSEMAAAYDASAQRRPPDDSLRAEAVFDRVEATLASSGDSLAVERMRSLRRRLLSAGDPSSKLADYRQKGALMAVLAALSSIGASDSRLTVAASDVDAAHTSISGAHSPRSGPGRSVAATSEAAQHTSFAGSATAPLELVPGSTSGSAARPDIPEHSLFSAPPPASAASISMRRDAAEASSSSSVGRALINSAAVRPPPPLDAETALRAAAQSSIPAHTEPPAAVMRDSPARLGTASASIAAGAGATTAGGLPQRSSQPYTASAAGPSMQLRFTAAAPAPSGAAAPLSAASSSLPSVSSAPYATAADVGALPFDREAALVRDLLFVLQGAEGRLVRWCEDLQAFRLAAPSSTAAGVPATAPFPEAAAQHAARVGELGWLVRALAMRMRQSLRPGDAASAMAPAVSAAASGVLPGAADSDSSSASNSGLSFVSDAGASGTSGASDCVTRRALTAALQREMDAYYEAIAGIDAAVAQDTAAASGGSAAGSAGHAGDGAATAGAAPRWSLRRLSLWSDEWLPRLRLLACILDACAGVVGSGALATVLHSFVTAYATDPQLAPIASRILGRSLMPWLNGVYAWLLTGQLPALGGSSSSSGGSGMAGKASSTAGSSSSSDSTGFFVVQADGGTRAVPPERMWRDLFSLDTRQLPSFVPDGLARDILDVGRSVHFLRAACTDAGWVAEALSKALLDLASAGVAIPQGALAACASTLDAVRRGGRAALDSAGSRGSSSTTDLVAVGAGAGAGAVALGAGGSGSGSGGGDHGPTLAAAMGAIADEFRVLQQLHGADVTGVTSLQCFVRIASPLVHARVLQQLHGSHHVIGHLRAIHRYVLLQQGDFVSVLVAAVAGELDRPAAALAVTLHSLEALVEGAIRASNAQHEDKDVLRRLSVRLLSPSPGDVGWDVFTLHYELTPPLSSVVTPDAAAAYGRLFHFLFRLRRVEHALAGAWSAHMAAAHALRALRHGGLNGVLHMCCLLRGDMATFVSNLLGYLTAEVLAAGWQRLSSALSTPGALPTFSQLLEAHEAHLRTLLDRALLSPRTMRVYRPLAALLEEALRFVGLHAAVLEAAQEQAALRRSGEAEIRQRAAGGAWGVPVGADDLDALEERCNAALTSIVASCGPRIADAAATYRGRMGDLLAAMEDAAATTDGCVSSLSVRLCVCAYVPAVVVQT